jgi:hypothetical protein
LLVTYLIIGGWNMNKKIACFLALSIVSMGFLAMLPTATAQTYGGSVYTGDDSDYTTTKAYFFLWEDVYYYIEATEDGAPLQFKYINITIHGPSEHYTDVVQTDQYGRAIDSWWGTGTPDLYTIYANYSGQNLAINTFRVYDPVPWGCEVITYMDNYRENGGIPAYYFAPGDYTYFSIYVTDQYGNPYYEPWWEDPDRIYYWIYHNEMEIDTDWDYTDSEGFIDDYHRPSSYFSTPEVYGQYQINVTREDGEPLNTTTFEVIKVEIDITPDDQPYAQGEEITIMVDTSIIGTVDIQILDPEDDVLSGASWTDQVLVNGQWTKDFLLGNTLPDGYYAIQVIKDDNVMKTEYFEVKKFNLELWTDNGAYLPGETMTVYYTITNNKDGSGVTDATLKWIFEYYDENDYEYKTNEYSFNTGPHGSFPVSIPSDAYEYFDADLYVWANDTSEHSDYEDEYVNLGGINAYLHLYDDKYVAGDFVMTYIYGYVEGHPLKNGNVYLNVSKDGTELTAYTKIALKTDKEGSLTYIFSLLDDAETGIYTVAINVSKEDAWDTDSETFEVVDSRELSVELGFTGKHYSDEYDPQYYSGETVAVTYTALRGEDIVSNVNCKYRVYYGSNIVAIGTTTSGEFSFTAPSDYDGTLTIYVEITDSDGEKAYSTAHISVSRAILLLETNINEYLPGDTIAVEYSTLGEDIANAQYFYKISDDHDNVIKKGSMGTTSGKFDFTVPDGNVPDSYSITGYIADSNGKTITSSHLGVTRLRGYLLTFTLDKNTYKPGETAKLTYEITSIDDSDIPEEFILYYGYGLPFFEQGSGPYRYLETSDTKGSLEIEVPEDAADGIGNFYIVSTLPYGEGQASAHQEANIRSSPNPLAETIGDISLLSWILLLLVIITLIMAFIGMRRGKKALNEAKLPPWKKEGPLPEPDKFKEPEPTSPEPTQAPMEEEMPPPPADEYPPASPQQPPQQPPGPGQM